MEVGKRWNVDAFILMKFLIGFSVLEADKSNERVSHNRFKSKHTHFQALKFCLCVLL